MNEEIILKIVASRKRKKFNEIMYNIISINLKCGGSKQLTSKNTHQQRDTIRAAMVAYGLVGKGGSGNWK